MIDKNKKLIKSNYYSTVATYSSVKSPQALIVATVARQFDFHTITAFGSSNLSTTLKKSKLFRLTNEISELRQIKNYSIRNKKIAENELKNLQEKEGFFIVDFGIFAKEVMNAVAMQCENLPDELDYLVVPSGSGVTLAAVAEGITRFSKNVKHLYGVQIAGYDRNKDVQRLTTAKYELKLDDTYDYEKPLKNFRFEDIELDATYEAKAFEWLQRNIDYKNNKTLFWVVANFNEFRF